MSWTPNLSTVCKIIVRDVDVLSFDSTVRSDKRRMSWIDIRKIESQRKRHDGLKELPLYREIAQGMRATGLVRAEDLLIVPAENDTADWSFGGGVAQYVEREQTDAEQKQGRQ